MTTHKLSSALEIEALLNELPATYLILFDIDDTLIMPQSRSFRIKAEQQIISEIKNDKDKYPNFEQILSNWRLSRKVILTDDAWPIVLERLKSKFTVYALSKMDIGKLGNIECNESWRFNELKSLGITFSENPGMIGGIIATGALSKSQKLQDKVDLSGYTGVVMIDDRPDMIAEIEALCHKLSLEFIGIEFLTAKPLESYDPILAAFQKDCLINKTQWLEDSEAYKLMQLAGEVGL